MSTKLKVGIFGGDTAGRTIDEVVADAAAAHDEGFSTYWLPQIFGHDALALLGLIGREVPDIELGTAVVPTYARHPMTMAQQALTAQAMSGGRLALGIGLSHKVVVEGMWGMSYDKPLRHMREYLTIVTALVQTGKVEFSGETLTAKGSIAVAGASPMPVLVAALGPKMLELAGGAADGTITWMTGPATIADHVVPAITDAAEAARRPAPRVVVGLPVCVTDDVETQRALAAKIYSMYGVLPSYRAMLDREGAADPHDIAIVGNEEAVRAQIEHLASIGATDLVAAEFAKPGSPERERTRALLRSM